MLSLISSANKLYVGLLVVKMNFATSSVMRIEIIKSFLVVTLIAMKKTELLKARYFGLFGLFALFSLFSLFGLKKKK